jgi:acyl-CoA dehydrogenase
MTLLRSFDDPRVAVLRQQARAAVQAHITPHGAQWERDGTTPHSAFRALGAAGLLGLCHAPEDGGQGLGPIASVVFAEELSASTYGGAAEAILIHAEMASPHLGLRGTAAQRQRHLPGLIRGEAICGIAVTEPDAGSDLVSLRTRARRDADGWVLDGVKTYATNAVHGDLMVVAARSDATAKASRGISLFLVPRDTPGLTIRAMPHKMGLHSSDIADLVFTGARLPHEALLGPEGQGFYAIMEKFQHERLVLAAMAIGMGAAALRLTLAHTQTRQAFGGPLWSQQTIRQRLSMLGARHTAVRTLVHATATRVAQGEDSVCEVSMAKALAGETVQDIMRDCVQFHGGRGYMADCAVERLARDARILTIGGGATEVMLEEVAKRLTPDMLL